MSNSGPVDIYKWRQGVEVALSPEIWGLSPSRTQRTASPRPAWPTFPSANAGAAMSIDESQGRRREAHDTRSFQTGRERGSYHPRDIEEEDRAELAHVCYTILTPGLHARKLARREKRAIRSPIRSPVQNAKTRQESYVEESEVVHRRGRKPVNKETWRTWRAPNVHLRPGARLTLPPILADGRGIFGRGAQSGPVTIGHRPSDLEQIISSDDEEDWRDKWKRSAGRLTESNRPPKEDKKEESRGPTEQSATSLQDRGRQETGKDAPNDAYYSPSWPTWRTSPTTTLSANRRVVSAHGHEGSLRQRSHGNHSPPSDHAYLTWSAPQDADINFSYTGSRQVSNVPYPPIVTPPSQITDGRWDTTKWGGPVLDPRNGQMEICTPPWEHGPLLSYHYGDEEPHHSLYPIPENSSDHHNWTTTHSNPPHFYGRNQFSEHYSIQKTPLSYEANTPPGHQQMLVQPQEGFSEHQTVAWQSTSFNNHDQLPSLTHDHRGYQRPLPIHEDGAVESMETDEPEVVPPEWGDNVHDPNASRVHIDYLDTLIDELDRQTQPQPISRGRQLLTSQHAHESHNIAPSQPVTRSPFLSPQVIPPRRVSDDYKTSVK